jgi:acyl-CoA thioester hydrolase
MPDFRYRTPLSKTDLRRLNISEPWTFGIADRTRFSELDPVGHVNNTAYLQWFETFRVHYFKDYGLAYSEPDAPTPVLRKVSVDFMAEMKLDEDYIVTGRTTSMRTTSLEMEYAIWSGGECRTTGYALLVFLNADGTRFSLTDTQRRVLHQRDNTKDTR